MATLETLIALLVGKLGPGYERGRSSLSILLLETVVSSVAMFSTEVAKPATSRFVAILATMLAGDAGTHSISVSLYAALATIHLGASIHLVAHSVAEPAFKIDYLTLRGRPFLLISNANALGELTIARSVPLLGATTANDLRTLL